MKLMWCSMTMSIRFQLTKKLNIKITPLMNYPFFGFIYGPMPIKMTPPLMQNRQDPAPGLQNPIHPIVDSLIV